MGKKLYIEFDVMCILISLLIILPIFIKKFREQINNIVIIGVALLLIILGISSIIYEYKITKDIVVFEKENKKYIYFGTALITIGIVNIAYILCLMNYKIGS